MNGRNHNQTETNSVSPIYWTDFGILVTHCQLLSLSQLHSLPYPPEPLNSNSRQCLLPLFTTFLSVPRPEHETGIAQTEPDEDSYTRILIRYFIIVRNVLYDLDFVGFPLQTNSVFRESMWQNNVPIPLPGYYKNLHGGFELRVRTFMLITTVYKQETLLLNINLFYSKSWFMLLILCPVTSFHPKQIFFETRHSKDSHHSYSKKI